MSVARPAARCLLRRSLAAAPATASSPASSVAGSCHGFHSSVQLAARRRPRFRNVRAIEMGLVTPEKIEEFSKTKFPDFSEADKEILKKRYSGAQREALQAGEAAVDPKDLTIQGRLRDDPYKFEYVEDFSRIAPVVDKRPKRKSAPDTDTSFMLPNQFRDDLLQWVQSFVPKDVNIAGLSDKELQAQLEIWGPKDADIAKYWLQRSALNDNGYIQDSALAPALPDKVPGVAGLYKSDQDPADEGRDPEGIWKDLKKQTNMSLRDIMSVTTKILVTRFVSNQTRLGKIRSLYVLAIAGNGNGKLGIGEAKGVESPVALAKAKQLAIRNMRPIPRYENRTIYGNVEAKVGATVVQMFNRPPGFGLRVSHRIFEMCRAAGIQDLSARMPRSRNPMNSVKATYKALMSQKDPDQIAIGRGKKMVDVRKVYYGGAVY